MPFWSVFYLSLITCQTNKCNQVSVFTYIETTNSFDESNGSHFSEFLRFNV